MARKSEVNSRVELWAPYRETIKKDFLKAQRKPKLEKTPQKIDTIVAPQPKVTRAEALLHEYEKKKEKEEVRRGPKPIFIVLAVIVFILIIIGLVWLIKENYV